MYVCTYVGLSSSRSHPAVKLVVKLSSSSSSSSANKQTSIVSKTASAVKQRYSSIISTRRGATAAVAMSKSTGAAAANNKAAAATDTAAASRSTTVDTLIAGGGHSGRVMTECVVNIERYAAAANASDGVAVVAGKLAAKSSEQLLVNEDMISSQPVANRSTASSDSSEMSANGNAEQSEASELVANRNTENSDFSELLANRIIEQSETCVPVANRSTEFNDLPANRNAENSKSSELPASRSTDSKQSAIRSTDHCEHAPRSPAPEEHGFKTVCTASDDDITLVTDAAADTVETESSVHPESTQPGHLSSVGAVTISEVLAAASLSECQKHGIADRDDVRENHSEDKLHDQPVGGDDLLDDKLGQFVEDEVAADNDEVSTIVTTTKVSDSLPLATPFATGTTSLDCDPETVASSEMNAEDSDSDVVTIASSEMDPEDETNTHDSVKHQDDRLVCTTVERSNLLSDNTVDSTKHEGERLIGGSATAVERSYNLLSDASKTVASLDVSTASSHVLGSISPVDQSRAAELTSSDIRESVVMENEENNSSTGLVMLLS